MSKLVPGVSLADGWGGVFVRCVCGLGVRQVSLVWHAWGKNCLHLLQSPPEEQVQNGRKKTSPIDIRSNPQPQHTHTAPSYIYDGPSEMAPAWADEESPFGSGQAEGGSRGGRRSCDGGCRPACWDHLRPRQKWQRPSTSSRPNRPEITQRQTIWVGSAWEALNPPPPPTYPHTHAHTRI